MKNERPFVKLQRALKFVALVLAAEKDPSNVAKRKKALKEYKALKLLITDKRQSEALDNIIGWLK